VIHQSAEDARALVNSEGKLHVRGCRLGWDPHGSTYKKGDLRGAGEDRTGELPNRLANSPTTNAQAMDVQRNNLITEK